MRRMDEDGSCSVDARGRREEPRREGKERENSENILIQVSEGEDEGTAGVGEGRSGKDVHDGRGTRAR